MNCKQLLFNSHNFRELLSRLRNSGQYAILDTFHLGRLSEFGLSYEEMVHTIAEEYPDILKEVHISTGRIDYNDSTDELVKLLAQEKNKISDTVRTLRQVGWSGRYVIEIPIGALLQVQKTPIIQSMRMSPSQIGEVYRPIIEHIL